MKCHLCKNDAIGIFHFPNGCLCSESIKQALCAQHILKATPLNQMYLDQWLPQSEAFPALKIRWGRA